MTREDIDRIATEYLNDTESEIEMQNVIELADKALIYKSAIEDIKQEIKEEKEFAYADFERYKVECLGIDWEDAYDSSPQDDYRYGMERCIEIINKHLKGESE